MFSPFIKLEAHRYLLGRLPSIKRWVISQIEI